jgi:hypothetical protein
VTVTFVEEYRVVDKSGWGPGPWSDEPDKAVWVDEATGLDCMAVRHDELGHWCGYVGVPEGHPAHGKGYDDVDVDVSVHGGLTFSGLCRPVPDRPSHGICHIEQPGRPEHVFWLGFDLAHVGDLSPGMRATMRNIGMEDYHARDTYKSLDYVVIEVESLAAQLAEVTGA